MVQITHLKLAAAVVQREGISMFFGKDGAFALVAAPGFRVDKIKTVPKHSFDLK